jgi:hypothetical protein
MADEDIEVRARLIADADAFIDPMQAATQSLKHFQAALAPNTKLLTALGVAAGAGGYALLRYGKEAFSVAAKVAELNVAIGAVGKSTGIGAKKISDAAKAIRKNGIEMDAAQNIALKFAQNNLDLSKAAGVARVAQDLAVISQKNSTDTAELLTRAIQTGSSILLKSAGISRYASEGYAKYAKTLGKNSTQLTATERQQATINLIMEEGARVAGLYEAAMTEPGKVLRSFKRLQNDIKLEMGNALLKGFGPMIKAIYDMTSSFSKSVREGGAFAKIIEGLGVAIKELLQPMTDLFSRTHLFFKDLDLGQQSVRGIADQFKKFIPIVTAVGGALAAMAGRKLLGGLPLIGGLAKSLNPFLTGIMLLSALSPKLRDALMRIGESLKPMIPAVLALAAAFADFLARIAETTAEFLTAFGPAITTVLGGLGDTLKVVAGAFAALKPLVTIIGLVLLKGMIVNLITSTKAWGHLTKGLAAARLAFRTIIAEQKAYSLTAAQGSASISTMRAALFALRASLTAVKAAVVSLMASMLPLIAVFAAVEIFMAWRKEQQATEEKTQALTQAVKDQLYAMKGNATEIGKFVNEQKDLATALSSGSEEADKFGQSLQLMGTDAETVLTAFGEGKDAITNLNRELTAASGIKFTDDQFAGLLTIVENRGGWMNNDWLTESFSNLTDQQKEFVNNLKQLNDIAKSTDPADYVLTNIEYLAGIDKLGKKAYDYAMVEVFKNEAVEGSIDTYQEAIILQGLFAKKYNILNAAAIAQKAAQDKVKESLKETTPPTIQLINALNGLKDASDDNKVSAEAFAKQLYGDKDATNQFAQAVLAIRQQTGEWSDTLKNTKGNIDLFTKSGYDFYNQIKENSAKILELNGNTGDVVNYQKSAIEQFYKAGEAAGYTTEQIDGLLSVTGILAGLDKLTVKVDADIAAFTAKIKLVTEALALLMGQGDREGARQAQSVIYRLQGLVKALEDSKTAAKTGANSFSKFTDTTDAAKKAADALEKQKEKLRRKIMEVAEKALAKARQRMEEYKQAMDAMADAAKTAVYGSYSMTDALTKAEAAAQEHNDAMKQVRDEMNEYGKSVADSLKETISFNEALSGYQSVANEIKSANDKVAEAQSKVNEEQALYQDLLRKAETTTGRKARREAYEEAAKQLEKVTEAQTQLADATRSATAAQQSQKSVLDRLREQYKQAVDFSTKLDELVTKGLSKEGVDQLLGMGAETGLKFVEELLTGGGNAIGEVNTIFKDLAEMSDKQGKKIASGFFTIGNDVGADFISALSLQAQNASNFAEQVKRLIALGLSPNNIRMVLEAGVETGSKIAAAIEKGGVDTITQMNEMEASLRGQAENLATLLNNTFYKAGFDLATQIVQGIEDKIEKLNETLSDMTIGQLKEYLGKVQGEFDAITSRLSIAPADVSGANAQAGGEIGGASGGTAGRRSDADLKSLGGMYSSFKDAVKALHPLAVAKYTSDGTGLNAQEMAALRAQFPRLAAVPFANGGLVNKPTLGLIGEAGPEAVIPLNRMGQMSNGQTTINLTVNAGMGADGKSIGDAIVNELKRWSRKNGTIPVPTV